MNGPDVRRFFKARTNLLQNIQRAIQESGRTGHENFAQRHLEVLDALATVSHLSRTVRDLTLGLHPHSEGPQHRPALSISRREARHPRTTVRGEYGVLACHRCEVQADHSLCSDPEDFQETLMRYHARFQHNTEKQKAKRQRRTPAQMQAAAAQIIMITSPGGVQNQHGRSVDPMDCP